MEDDDFEDDSVSEKDIKRINAYTRKLYIRQKIRTFIEHYVEDVIDSAKSALWLFKWLLILLSSAILLWLFIMWVTSLAADKYYDSDNGWWLTMPFIALTILIILIPRRFS